MAICVPTLDQLNTLGSIMGKGEEPLLQVLRSALSDEWTIYAQPFMNGHRPDIVIFCPEYGIGIIEVKHYHLDVYDVNIEAGRWLNRRKGEQYSNPFTQVEWHRNALIYQEIPIIGGQSWLNQKLFSYVKNIVYFHGYETAILNEKFANRERYQHVIGDDIALNESELRNFIYGLTNYKARKYHLEFTQKQNIEEKLQQAFGKTIFISDHARQHLMQNFNRKQRDLLRSDVQKQHVRAAAGSGKTVIAVHRAVGAAAKGHKVLFTCFNITMANSIRYWVNQLCAIIKKEWAAENIVVTHYDRWRVDVDEYRELYTDYTYVIVDEGQDFTQDQIDKLLNYIQPERFLLLEDDSQDIYGTYSERESKDVLRIGQRPFTLKKSYRLPTSIATLANGLNHWAGYYNDSSENIAGIPKQMSFDTTASWFNGNYNTCLQSLADSLKREVENGTTPSNVTILVSEVAHGWDVCDILDKLDVPFTAAFESREEYENLKAQYVGDRFEWAHNSLRRGYKVEFVQGREGVKVSTLHSYKGWQADTVYVLFAPKVDVVDPMQQTHHLYTAITRSQNYVTVFCAAERFYEFGDLAIQHGLVEPVGVKQHDM